MIEILCDDSTICKEACDNNDYHRSRHRQTFNMTVKSMGISLHHFIYCIVLYKCKTIFYICSQVDIVTYVTRCYRLTPRLTECKHFLLNAT